MQNNKIVLEIPYLIVYLNPDLNIFEAFWQKKDREMTDDEFINHLEEFSQLFNTYQVKGFFVDTRAYHVVMAVEIQTWHDEVIIPRYIAGGVQKIAFVMIKELIPALSIEQTFTETQAKSLEVRFFEDEIAAKAWISQ